VLKLLCAALLAYVLELFFVTIPWGKVLFNTVVPHFQFNKTYVAILIAVLGTTISPYLFFWQNMERLEDLRAEAAGGSKPLPLGRRTKSAARMKRAESRFDVFFGMGFSNVVMFAIIVVTSLTIGKHGHHVDINSRVDSRRTSSRSVSLARACWRFPSSRAPGRPVWRDCSDGRRDSRIRPVRRRSSTDSWSRA
jgi:Mn2+/Fe2+ NRAMP family transporter